ncbi:carbohydrate kinase [Streptomyces rubiginosohelvolus]|uniref:carbohydrate kinase family protein n=1 Tax=Streptomyces rubiginosohelvolus TaxID=67362 RepID=UPI0036BB1382
MIVVAGEALVDLVGGCSPLAPLTPTRGGGPYNTAVALGRLGSATGFCSRISTDAYGKALLEGLTEAGVNTRMVQRGPEPTSLTVARIAPDGSASYDFYTEGTADRLFQEPVDLPLGVRAVHFGTCSLALEPGASAYEELMKEAAWQGTFVALDPNIRPSLIADPDAYRKRFRSWLRHVTLLKVSEEDARWLGGGPSEWLAAGPAAVVITAGSSGMTVFTQNLEVSVSAPAVDVVDTVGAGDSVNAALLHALSKRGTLELRASSAVAALDAEAWTAILGFAARAAAITCSRTGAEPPYAAEVDAAITAPG